MEQTVFSWLLQLKIPTVLVLAEALSETWSAEIEIALREQRLLIITHCEPNIHRITAQSAYDRNQLMISLADKIIIGYCTNGGNIEKQIKGLSNVIYLK